MTKKKKVVNKMENTREYYAQFYERAKERVKENYVRKNAIFKHLAKIDEEIDIVSKCGIPDTIKISVDWKKSSMWGMNPHAEVRLCLNNYDIRVETYAKATVGGCGYDKESSAVARALNDLLPMKKLLMDNWTNGQQECLGYGISQWSQNTMPLFDGGVGMDCFVDAINKIGYECTEMHSKTFDGYEFRRIK